MVQHVGSLEKKKVSILTIVLLKKLICNILICFPAQFCLMITVTVKPALSSHSKIRPKIGFQDAKCRSKVLQNAPREHSAILSTFIKLPFVFKTFILSIFEWPFKTGFTILQWIHRLNVKLWILRQYGPRREKTCLRG